MIELLTAIGLVFVIEGIVLALFTEHSKKIMMQILPLPNNHLKMMGVIAALFGLAIVSIAKGI